MSLFAEYLAELGQKQIIEDDNGFATYFEIPTGMYIEDIFVKKDKRHTDVASKYADSISMIAKEKGLTKLYGSVKPSVKTSTSAMRVLLAYGFKLEKALEDAIIFVKEL